MKVLFTYLVAFSGNGGIQKFNRCFIKALHDLHNQKAIQLSISSPYDSNIDEKYIEKSLFINGLNKFFFFLSTLISSFNFDVVILGHINLASLGWTIKLLFPQKKVILITHGIEVWRPLSFFGRAILENCDSILAVSQFTKDVISKNHSIDPLKIVVFHNTIDPFLKLPSTFTKPKYLIDRYGIKPNNKVLVTIARLSSSELYKGYDLVIDVLGKLTDLNLIYLIGGKYDEAEKQRINLMIKTHQLEKNVFLTGYVNDLELTDHYLLADLFIMPSKKEGFGIVFIEAMACGLKVIAGNKDGSVDALRNGELGYLINPDSKEEIETAIFKAFENPLSAWDKTILQQKVIEYFGFDAYKKRLANVLESL
ncbi:MAG: glycosyltransferase family 4 protein [Cytophagales bacterium]